MAREWQMYPVFDNVETPWGFVKLAVTDPNHIAVDSGKTGGLALKNKSHIIMAHLNFENGAWRATHVYSSDSISEATKKSVGQHLADFITTWTAQHPEALVAAAEANHNNALHSAEVEVEEAQAKLDQAQDVLIVLLAQEA